jgi:Fe-S-cluster containining protein
MLIPIILAISVLFLIWLSLNYDKNNIDEDNDYVFSTLPCPFLGSDHYCHVYESRPNACREFPHTQQRNILQKLKITYHNTHICPAVSLVVEGLKQKYVL